MGGKREHEQLEKHTEVEAAMRRAKRPRVVLAGPYGHPVHALLVTLPIGAWSASLLFDILAAVGVAPEALRTGAAGLVAIGVVGALAAGAAGLIDLSSLARETRARRIALAHMAINSGAILIFGVGLWIRVSDGVGNASVGGIILGVLGLVLVGVSGFLGGELTYRYGVRVADEQTQAHGYNTGTTKAPQSRP